MPFRILQPKRQAPSQPALCVPSAFCLECPTAERQAVCFFRRKRPTDR